MKIQKFRLTRRLVGWLDSREGREWRRENKDDNGYSRLPPTMEGVFFTSKEDPEIIARNLAR